MFRGKLGKLPAHPVDKSRRVSFAALFGTDLPQPAAARDWTGGATSRPDFGNLQVGDCTCAAVANIMAGWVKVAYGKDWLPTTSEVLALYSAVTGYDPRKTDAQGNNPTDTGAVVEDVLTYVLKHGFAGHHLIGSAAIDPGNVVNVKRAIDWFGAVDLGIELPVAWEQAETWDVSTSQSGDWAPGSAGGHCISAERYDERGLYVWTWGELIPMTWAAVGAYCDTVDVPIGASWIKTGKTPAGISLSTLEARMAQIRAA